MPRRQIRYPEKPHRMDPAIERRFQEIIADGKRERKDKKPLVINPKWQLWRWDTLEDVPDMNT